MLITGTPADTNKTFSAQQVALTMDEGLREEDGGGMTLLDLVGPVGATNMHEMEFVLHDFVLMQMRGKNGTDDRPPAPPSELCSDLWGAKNITHLIEQDATNKTLYLAIEHVVGPKGFLFDAGLLAAAKELETKEELWHLMRDELATSIMRHTPPEYEGPMRLKCSGFKAADTPTNWTTHQKLRAALFKPSQRMRELVGVAREHAAEAEQVILTMRGECDEGTGDWEKFTLTLLDCMLFEQTEYDKSPAYEKKIYHALKTAGVRWVPSFMVRGFPELDTCSKL
ncbi:hypothetical protein TI39_contig4603g00001 [Zymoseptoria brevis]|uniref:Uncharacterized protein n=1 Tax=Zymoseptoria brevis TaxID=1047168 RepID=A0A0F4G797_9PEZI|nr:hypothetical protein TI39_contig4603g00001 [Zymoseptoria brevis]